jgi:hypothetical protein
MKVLFQESNPDRAIAARAEFLQGCWQLTLLFDATDPQALLGSRGQRRRWRQLSRALEYVVRLHPSVASFQLCWPRSRPRRMPGP